jgi:flavocytochrome c
LFVNDTLRAGHDKNQRVLVEKLVTESTEAIAWLESFNLALSKLSQCGGHSVKRTHRLSETADGKPNPIGWTLISTLKRFIEQECPGIEILTNSRVNDVKRTASSEYIVYYTGQDHDSTLSANSVIFTTGGYSHDWTSSSLLQEFGSERILSLPTTNGPWATGDGLKILRGMNAKLIDMECIQVHPTAFIKLSSPSDRVKFLAPEALRGHGGILLNQKGSRFVDELQTRDHVSNAIFQNCQLDNGSFRAWLLLSESVAQEYDSIALSFYKKMGLFYEFDNLASLASFINVDFQALQNTILEYNNAAVNGNDTFGKTVFPSLVDLKSKKFFIAAITPAIHYTMGGVQIDENARVVAKDQATIDGIFAAGEVTGSVHGENRLAVSQNLL